VLTDFTFLNFRLNVYIDRASNLPRKSATTYAYPTLVQVALLPGERTRFDTRAAINTRVDGDSLVARYEDQGEMKIKSHTEMTQKWLRLTVINTETHHRDTVVGHALSPLANIPVQVTKHHLQLSPKSQPTESTAQLLISLNYHDEQASLVVGIYRAREIILDSGKGSVISPETLKTFVKVSLFCAGEKVKTRRTKIAQPVASPVYNQSFEFILPIGYLDDTSVVIKLMAKGLFNNDHLIAKSVAGPYIYLEGETLTHWGMMLKTKQSVTQWHNLYP